MRLGTKQVMRGLKRIKANTRNGNTLATPYTRGSFTRKKLAQAHKQNRKIVGGKTLRNRIASTYGYEG